MLYLHRGTIYTLDPQQPIVSSLLIDHGRIVAVEAAPPDGAATLDLGGRAVIPGLIDAHLHLEYFSLGLKKVDCETPTRQQCLQRVAERAAQTPPGQWVLGHGWNQNAWPEAAFPTAADLDAVAPHHPVYLTAKSLHAAWANSAALKLASVQGNMPDPAGGKLGRTAAGEPDGMLYESAMDLVAGAIPQPTIEEVAEAMLAAQPVLWQMGLTGVHDFDRRRSFAALQLLRQRGLLRLRVVKSIPLEDMPHAIAVGLRSGFGNDWLRVGGVKAFADGALGPQTAAMLQPYNGSAENRGILMLDAETLFEHGRAAVANGLSLAVHAIGDRANHEMLNAFERLRSFEHQISNSGAPNLLRHRIEHVQLLHPADLPRLGQLGVIASMQPIHATSDMHMADRYWGERAANSYAWRAQLQAGAALAFGSDAPVESPNPFWGLHAAVTRQRQDGSPGEDGWQSAQRLSLAEALAAYTRGAAYAAGMEDRLGCLSPGFWADLLVLERDPFTVPARELHTLRPAATMLAGEWVWQQPGGMGD